MTFNVDKIIEAYEQERKRILNINVRNSQLEENIDNEDYLRNEVLISDEKEVFLYVAEALEISFVGKNIYAKTKLTKYGGEVDINQDKLLTNSQELWSIGDKVLPDIIYSAKLHSIQIDYINNLKGSALNKGIKLSDDLLNKTFKPIEEKIKQMYKTSFS